MTKAMSKALERLNAATGREYSIRQEGALFALTMPLGGEYPEVDSVAMLQRLITLTCAAEGRGAIKPPHPKP